MLQVALPDLETPAKIVFDAGHPLSDDEYFELCQANPDLIIERNGQGELIIMPPPGSESDYRSLEIGGQLRNWATLDGRGKVFAAPGFLLANGACRAPDAAWVSNEQIARFTKEERRKFMRLAPEFVVEVLSPTDRLTNAKAKMVEWMANGVQLGWLIDGDNRTVYVYRPGQEPEIQRDIQKLAGKGPIKGFVLDLEPIWQGL